MPPKICKGKITSCKLTHPKKAAVIGKKLENRAVGVGPKIFRAKIYIRNPKAALMIPRYIMPPTTCGVKAVKGGLFAIAKGAEIITVIISWFTVSVSSV